jgi:hypothetical protein
MHQVADKVCSRKPLCTISDAYTLGPVVRGDSAIDCKIRPNILLPAWMDIHLIGYMY